MCQSGRVRPSSPLAYLGALLLVIGGWMAGTIVAAGAWDLVRDAPTATLQEPVEVGDGAVAVFTDVLQPEREIRCTTRPVDDDETEPVRMPGAPVDLTVERGGSTWYLLAFEPDVSGQVRVSCAPTDDNGDAATYRAGAVEGVRDRVQLGNGVAWLSTLAGIGLAGWTWWNRRRARQDA